MLSKRSKSGEAAKIWGAWQARHCAGNDDKMWFSFCQCHVIFYLSMSCYFLFVSVTLFFIICQCHVFFLFVNVMLFFICQYHVIFLFVNVMLWFVHCRVCSMCSPRQTRQTRERCLWKDCKWVKTNLIITKDFRKHQLKTPLKHTNMITKIFKNINIITKDFQKHPFPLNEN